MKRLRTIGLVMAATFCATQADAQELTGTLKKVKETGAITIGYRDSSIPFSYLDDNQKPIGFAIDICRGIVEGVKKELKLDKLEVKLNPVTSSTRASSTSTTAGCGSCCGADRRASSGVTRAASRAPRFRAASFAPTDEAGMAARASPQRA